MATRRVTGSGWLDEMWEQLEPAVDAGRRIRDGETVTLFPVTRGGTTTDTPDAPDESAPGWLDDLAKQFRDYTQYLQSPPPQSRPGSSSSVWEELMRTGRFPGEVTYATGGGSPSTAGMGGVVGLVLMGAAVWMVARNMG